MCSSINNGYITLLSYSIIRFMEKLNILVIGGTGFIGTTLCKHLKGQGYSVTALSRLIPPDDFDENNIGFLQADVTIPGKWQKLIPEYDVIINLTGASIFRRWTARGKKEILDSRIIPIRNIHNTLCNNKGRVKQLFSVSGVGYYGFHGDEMISEEEPAGSDFLAQVAKKWEEEAEKVQELGIRLVICRFGHVLGMNGGILPKLSSLAKWHLAGRWGSGKQWTSWIHEKDLAKCVMFLLEKPEITGPVNVTSPKPVRNHELMDSLSNITGKSGLIPPIPKCLLRLITGEFASVFVNGQRAIPDILLHQGFRFDYPDIPGALKNIIQNPDSLE